MKAIRLAHSKVNLVRDVNVDVDSQQPRSIGIGVAHSDHHGVELTGDGQDACRELTEAFACPELTEAITSKVSWQSICNVAAEKYTYCTAHVNFRAPYMCVFDRAEQCCFT